MKVPDYDIDETLEHLDYVQSFLNDLEKILGDAKDKDQEGVLRAAVAQTQNIKKSVETLKQMVVNLHNKSIQ